MIEPDSLSASSDAPTDDSVILIPLNLPKQNLRREQRAAMANCNVAKMILFGEALEYNCILCGVQIDHGEFVCPIHAGQVIIFQHCDA